MDELQALRAAIDALDRRLRPIANRTVEINEPGWNVKLAMAPNPLDEAGVRTEAKAALLAAINLYSTCGADKRNEIRDMFRRNSAFAWTATLPFDTDNTEHTFAHLVHFSLIDQGSDARDAVLRLGHLVSKAQVPPEELQRLLERVATMSSDVDLYGFGSTRQLLAPAYGPSSAR
jgi:hypothetical protein